jgi:uncharacterized damage-inducible protein DinB
MHEQMSDLAGDIAALLVRELHGIQRELDLFPDDDSVWRVAPGVSNSAGNLALHVAENLQHFVGAVLGGTAYVRNRSAEFDRRTGTRQDLAAEIQAAMTVILDVVPTLQDDSLSRRYPESPGLSKPLRTRRFLLHLCAHAAYHLGQIGYLRRVLTTQNLPSGALSLESLS